MDGHLLTRGGTSVPEGGSGKTAILGWLLSMNSESGSGQSSDPHHLESRARALPDNQHDHVASLHATDDEVLAPSTAVLGLCGDDGVSTHPQGVPPM